MNDLNALLDRAAGPSAVSFDPAADLARGRAALSRTRRRRGALGLAGVAALGVVGVGLDRTGSRGDVVRDPVASAPTATTPPPVTAGPYTVPALPDGWEVQGSRPQVETIAPVGVADQEPLSFPGKLVLGYDRNRPSGEKVQRDGRTFWVNANGDTTIVSTRTRAEEPAGELTLQFPTSAFTTDEMVTFLAGVEVGPGALPSFG
jgi:hypothetical protein